MMDSIDYCQDCKKNTAVVLDHSTGDSICSECGLVLDSYFIDESCEWRIFSDDNNDEDPNRVGGRSNPLLIHSNLSTMISKPNGAKGDFVTSKWQTYESNLDRTLMKGFETIGIMADRLGLVATIKDRANEIYKKMEDQKSRLERNRHAISAACLYIACRESKSPRTLKEICSAAYGVSKKEINKAVELIRKRQDIDMGSMHASELVRRFCSNLGMKNQAMKAVQEAADKSEEIDIRRSPKSVLAAIIYMTTQLSDEKKSLRGLNSP